MKNEKMLLICQLVSLAFGMLFVPTVFYYILPSNNIILYNTALGLSCILNCIFIIIIINQIFIMIGLLRRINDIDDIKEEIFKIVNENCESIKHEETDL